MRELALEDGSLHFSTAATESYKLNFGITPILSDISELIVAAIPTTGDPGLKAASIRYCSGG